MSGRRTVRTALLLGAALVVVGGLVLLLAGGDPADERVTPGPSRSPSTTISGEGSGSPATTAPGTTDGIGSSATLPEPTSPGLSGPVSSGPTSGSPTAAPIPAAPASDAIADQLAACFGEVGPAPQPAEIFGGEPGAWIGEVPADQRTPALVLASCVVTTLDSGGACAAEVGALDPSAVDEAWFEAAAALDRCMALLLSGP